MLNVDPKQNTESCKNQELKISKISEKKRSKAKRIHGKIEKFDPKICPNFDACKGKGNTSNKSGKRHFLLKNCPYVLSESDRNELQLINNLEFNSLNEVNLSFYISFTFNVYLFVKFKVCKLWRRKYAF